MKPTKTGAAILAVLDKRCGSLRAAARESGICEMTLRRWVFRDPRPSTVSRDLVAKFSKVGVGLALLI